MSLIQNALTKFVLVEEVGTATEACTLLEPNSTVGLSQSKSRFLCRQCLSYRMPKSTTKYSTSAKNTNSVHDSSQTSIHFSSSALGELFLCKKIMHFIKYSHLYFAQIKSMSYYLAKKKVTFDVLLIQLPSIARGCTF